MDMFDWDSGATTTFDMQMYGFTDSFDFGGLNSGLVLSGSDFVLGFQTGDDWGALFAMEAANYLHDPSKAFPTHSSLPTVMFDGLEGADVEEVGFWVMPLIGAFLGGLGSLMNELGDDKPGVDTGKVLRDAIIGFGATAFGGQIGGLAKHLGASDEFANQIGTLAGGLHAAVLLFLHDKASGEPVS